MDKPTKFTIYDPPVGPFDSAADINAEIRRLQLMIETTGPDIGLESAIEMLQRWSEIPT